MRDLAMKIITLFTTPVICSSLILHDLLLISSSIHFGIRPIVGKLILRVHWFGLINTVQCFAVFSVSTHIIPSSNEGLKVSSSTHIPDYHLFELSAGSISWYAPDR